MHELIDLKLQKRDEMHRLAFRWFYATIACLVAVILVTVSIMTGYATISVSPILWLLITLSAISSYFWQNAWSDLKLCQKTLQEMMDRPFDQPAA